MTNTIVRPPIVTVLGHVDHGKTTLLDAIRKTNIASREVGGITQSIGAWQAVTKEGKKITFIDTPGHQDFAAMRQRGAKIADLAILVVAADSGVAPQTKESIEYLQEAATPFLVAITKIDLPSADPESVKDQLAKSGVLLEDRGGDVVSVLVSSKTGQGIDELLDLLLLLAELIGVSGRPDDTLEAPIFETKKDSKRGLVVSAVVRSGTLSVGQSVEAEGVVAKVRGLFNEHKQPINKALPGTPVEILGFDLLPPVGSVIHPAAAQAKLKEEKSIKLKKVEGFPVILKADTTGALEAILTHLSGQVGVVFSGVGDISESDIELAEAAGATIVGFNVRAPARSNARIYTYKVIYDLFGDIENWIKESKKEEKVLGRAEIIAQFPHSKGRIAGSRLIFGRIAKADRVRLVRNNKVIGEVRLISMRRQKEEIESTEGQGEFGVYFEPQLDFQIGDMLESFEPPRN